MQNAIGILAPHGQRPSETVLAQLKSCYLYNIPAYYFSFADIRRYRKEGILCGGKWEDGQVKIVELELPKYLEISFRTTDLKKKYPEDYQWMRENCIITDEFGLDKIVFQHALAKSSLSANAIPTFAFSTYEELVPMLPLIPNAILKPGGGTKSKGLMKLITKNGQTMYDTRFEKGIFTKESFTRYADSLKSSIKYSEYYLLEPCLNILSDDGRAIDFRCLVSLNGENKWENVLTYARVGGSDVASNFSGGGTLNLAKDMLQMLVPGKEQEMLSEIERVARGVGEVIQKESKNHVSYLGIDICIDRDTDQIYVIEANSKPGVKLVGPWPLALVRAQYFKYILEHGI